MRAKLLVTILTVTFAAAAILQAQSGAKKTAPTKTAPAKTAPAKTAAPAVPAGPALSAYERMDLWLLAENLTAMHMTETLRAMSEEYKGDASVSGLSGYAAAEIGLANLETDPAVRRKLLDEAAESLPKLVEKTRDTVKEEDTIKNLGYRLKLVDLLGRSQCALHADVLLMLMGGEEDRRIIMQYTGVILTPKKAGGRTMLELLQDDIDAEVEKVNGNSEIAVNNQVPLETLQNELKYSTAWFKVYRGLASTVVNERADLLEGAREAADKYAKGDWPGAEGPDAASLLVQGEASTELAMTWRMKAKAAKDSKSIEAQTAASDAEKEFGEADKYLKNALDCKSVPDDDGKQHSLITPDLKVSVLYQIARNLIEWGKYDDALKAVDAYGPTIVKPELLGKDAEIRAAVNTAMLKNHLYFRWAENTTDKTQADKYRLLSQAALMDFISAHKEQVAIIAAFYKIIANKYRDAPTPPPGIANDDKYVDDYLGKLNPVFQFAIAKDEFNTALDLCDQKDPAKLKETIKTNAAAKKRMEKADKLLTMIIDNKGEEAIPLQAQASELAGVVEELLDMGWEAGTKSVASGKKDGVLNGCVIFRRILSAQNSGDKTAARRKEFIAALTTLLGNAQWVKDPKVSIWYVDMGEQYSKSADAQSAPDKKIPDYQEGIKAYRLVAQTNQQTYMYSQYKALSMEYDMIQTVHDTGGDNAKVSALSGEFIKRLGEYVNRVKDAIKPLADASAKLSDGDTQYLAALRYWGADSAFLCDVVKCEYLNLKTQAMDDLDKLPAQWPDSPDVLEKATVYEVQQHIALGEITQASEHIEEMKKLHPHEANALMQLVIGKLRKQIHDIENKPDKAPEFKRQREMYLKFADDLLKTHPNDYAFEQMRADALLVSDQFDEALKMFEQLAKTEQENRAASEKVADAFVDKLAAAMDKAQGNIPEVLQLAEEFPKAVKEKRIDASSKGYAGALATVLAYAKGTTTDPADAEERARQVVQAYKAAMTGLRKDLKVDIPRDSVNMAGLAKLYYLQKKYEKALENYMPLVSGLWVTANDKHVPEDLRKSYLAQYAQALLDKTRCEYEYFMTTADLQKKKKQMQNLDLRIKEFHDRNSEFWGLYADFNKIDSEAKTIAESK
jgi:hypothetical protein